MKERRYFYFFQQFRHNSHEQNYSSTNLTVFTTDTNDSLYAEIITWHQLDIVNKTKQLNAWTPILRTTML